LIKYSDIKTDFFIEKFVKKDHALLQKFCQHHLKNHYHHQFRVTAVKAGGDTQLHQHQFETNIEMN